MTPTTPAVIRSVVEAFCPGSEVTVIEHFSQYQVEIHFTVTETAVEDKAGLDESLDLIMPAHLSRSYSTTIDASGSVICVAGSEGRLKIDIYPEGDYDG